MAPTAQLYPGARWHPLGMQSQPLMTAHDQVCLHTMVGYLTSTDGYFRISNGEGFRGTESHYGLGGKWGPDLGGDLDGAIWQWQDRRFTADCNGEGNGRIISIETADNAPQSPADIEAWTPAQVDAIVKLLTWECSKAAHAACPTSWYCHANGIPAVLVPDSKPGRKGISYHRLGCDPFRVSGGESWSSSYGKECPTRRRIEQLTNVIIPRVRNGGGPAPSPAPSPKRRTPDMFLYRRDPASKLPGEPKPVGSSGIRLHAGPIASPLNDFEAAEIGKALQDGAHVALVSAGLFNALT